LSPNDDDKPTCELEDVPPEENASSCMNPIVFGVEIQQIIGSRRQRGVDKAADELCERGELNDKGYSWPVSVDLDLVGLALSGGGIRSSTFCLGVLQALNDAGVIKWVDYISTVSGGGYIGCFWSCLLQNSRITNNEGNEESSSYLSGSEDFKKKGPLFKLSHEAGVEEGPVFQRLRNYANYLQPRGLRDTIRFPALVLRGLFINFLMGLPYLLFAAALTAWIFATNILNDKLGFWGWTDYTVTKFVLGAYLGLIVWSTICQSLKRRAGKSSPAIRSRILLLNSLGLLALALVAFIEFQPRLIYWLRGYMNQEWSVLEFSALGALGALTAFLSAIGAARSAGLTAKIGLATAGAVVPLIVIVLYFTLCVWAVFPGPSWLPDYLEHINYIAVTYVGVGVILLLLSAFFFDVNAITLHNYYRDSLSKTFLFSLQNSGLVRRGANHAEGDYDRDEDGITLAQLDIAKNGGPFHLINAVVNNPKLNEIGLRGRRADFFVFSGTYTGNNRLGYCSTAQLETLDKSANLGTAMAVSAAAVSPSMGQKTSNPLMVFLMAMLNVRLGYWLPVPELVTNDRTTSLKKFLGQSHLVGPFFFFREMFGLIDLFRTRYINLSDGGHLENLGVFELLRRRCEYIIAIDAEADPEMKFNGLANLMRLARTDLGVDIEIDLDDLRKEENGFSRRHWALGEIVYGKKESGVFLYIKSSLTGSENEYITEYRARHPEFPHQSTGDQFFDEAQFEAHRALGHKAGASLFNESSSEFAMTGAYGTSFDVTEDVSSADYLFEELRKRDTSAVMRRDSFLRLQDRRRAIESKLTKPSIRRYAEELVDLPSSPGSKKYRSEPIEEDTDYKLRLHQLVNEQMQLIEASIFALRLYDPKIRRRKSNLGWMNLFRRWSNSSSFRRNWAASVAHYGTAFKLFCKEELGLDLRVFWKKRKSNEKLTRSEEVLLKKARRENIGGTPLQVYMAHLATAGDPDGKKNSVRVAMAIVACVNGTPALTYFRVRETYRSIGLSRMLLRKFRDKKSVWNGPHAFCRDPQFDTNIERIKRILRHLEYRNLSE